MACKETKKLIRDLTRQGFDVVRTRRGHYTVRRDGRFVTMLSGTPSDWRAMHNARAQLRAAGF